jgi:hypothetical protein
MRLHSEVSAIGIEHAGMAGAEAHGPPKTNREIIERATRKLGTHNPDTRNEVEAGMSNRNRLNLILLAIVVVLLGGSVLMVVYFKSV